MRGKAKSLLRLRQKPRLGSGLNPPVAFGPEEVNYWLALLMHRYTTSGFRILSALSSLRPESLPRFISRSASGYLTSRKAEFNLARKLVLPTTSGKQQQRIRRRHISRGQTLGRTVGEVQTWSQRAPKGLVKMRAGSVPTTLGQQ